MADENEALAADGFAVSRRDLMRVGAATALVPTVLTAPAAANARPAAMIVETCGLLGEQHMHFPQHGPME